MIYQFAMRDLVGQHWPVVRLPIDAAPVPAAPADPSEIGIEGTIVQTSQVPNPATAPYASCVGMTRVRVDRVLRGTFDGRELVAGFLVMRNRALLPAARYARGRPRAPAARAVQPRGPGHPKPAALRRSRGRRSARVLDCRGAAAVMPTLSRRQFVRAAAADAKRYTIRPSPSAASAASPPCVR